MASERDLSLTAFTRYAELHPEVDRELDRRMVEVVKRGNVVLEGRLSLWHARQARVEAFGVLVVAPEAVRAKRVAQRERRTDWEIVLQENRAREASERHRYVTLYRFDPADPAPYDIVLDSAQQSADQLADAVVERVATRQGGGATVRAQAERKTNSG